LVDTSIVASASPLMT